jgi:hypothetical protein
LLYSRTTGKFIYIFTVIVYKLIYKHLGTVRLEKHPLLSPTHTAVFQLMKTLLYKAYEFTLFCDNLFGNPKLFSLLRELRIRACGTTRRQGTKLVFGNIDDWKATWGDLRSKVVPTTLVSVWQDSNKVGFCTTIHNGTE